MKSSTTIRSPGAMALGLLFACATGYVLLEEIFHGGTISTSHVLTAVALIGTISSAHMAVTEMKCRRIMSAVGLGVIFVSGTTYTVISAGSRNAEVAIRKAEAINQANADRATITTERLAAMAMLEDERLLLARECKSGAGSKCKGIQQSIAVYSAAVAGHDARLSHLGPARSANAGFHHAAEVVAALPFVTTPAAEIERAITLIMPFLIVVVVELSTIVFPLVALGSETVAAPTPPRDKAPLPVVPDLEASETDRVVSWARAFEAKHGRAPKQSEMRAAFDLAKSTAHRIFHTHLRVA